MNPSYHGVTGESQSGGHVAMTLPRLALHTGLMQVLLSIIVKFQTLASGHGSVVHREMLRLHDHMVPGSILPWDSPFGKREDSCKPPQGVRLYPCAWFQVQDPSEACLDLAIRP